MFNLFEELLIYKIILNIDSDEQQISPLFDFLTIRHPILLCKQIGINQKSTNQLIFFTLLRLELYRSLIFSTDCLADFNDNDVKGGDGFDSLQKDDVEDLVVNELKNYFQCFVDQVACYLGFFPDSDST